MKILDYLHSHLLILDGGMGTLLQARGLRPGEHPEHWNLTHADDIIDIQRAYFEAGSNVVNTNTFGANPLKFEAEELTRIIEAAVRNADEARKRAAGEHPKYISLDIGPLGRLLQPFGDLPFEEAVAAFAEIVRIGSRCGVDLITIETMNDMRETKAALLAAKENSSLPVLVTNAYGEDGHLMTGASPAAMAALLEGMGADMIGLNCSFGPKQLAPVARELLRVSSRPVVLKPNAGIPRDVDGKTVFDVGPEEFAADVAALVREGVRVVGGCCGTTPEYIVALKAAVREIEPVPVTAKHETVISSYTKAVSFGADPVMIGERINPTGKKRMQQALRAGDLDLILEEGIGQQEAGAKVLDVNVGLPDLDEAALLPQVVEQLQAVCDLPLQLDSADPVAMEAALRAYNGKPLINSVNGKAESLAAVLPLVKKYGGVVVALTLDEAGIPADAEGRVAIAKKILQAAEEAGIDKKDLLFDPLAMAVSADPGAARVTLEAVERITRELGCRTVLGVSNISFGLPARGALNGAFLSAALARGLSAAILNPHSPEMQRAWCAHRALHGLDADFSSWLVFAALDTVRTVKAEDAAAVPAEEPSDGSALQRAIVKGLKDQAGALAAELLTETEPLALVQQEIIPALDRVGQGFERKTVYLPQLLMAAEAAKSAFAEVKRVMEQGDRPAESAVRCPVVLATVEGDIHDIGKNIVALLLENYGFAVHDLGRDVPPQRIVDEVQRTGAPLAGLSALMTTTVPAMERTIALLREQAPACRVVVGGAVLTESYAARIGADRYAKDAMETVRYAEEVSAAR